MYCPKCNDSFEEGSRRFCPTDGARLITDDLRPESSGNRAGVFSNLMPRMNQDSARDNVLSEEPKQFVKEPEFDLFRDDLQKVANAEPFFEIGDLPPDADLVPNFAVPEPPHVDNVPPPVSAATPSATEPPPVGRKVNPYDIPAGHVELDDSERTAGIFNEFDPDDPESFVGRVVKGRYLATEFLGGDESGLAFLADDKLASDKMVLVRILLEDETDEIMNSILAEERVSLSHFSHPNVARLIDSGEFNNGTQFLISEYVDALSVRDVLGIHQRFDPLRTARVIRQVSYALNEAHQEGIIHRDVCPENIILAVEMSGAEQTKLINLGASNGEPNQENAAYKAPEVLDGRIPTVASDIFSLAAVAYEMLFGKIPFEGSTAKDIIRVQYDGLKAHPSAERPELPYAVDDVLAKALAFNTVDRYPKARDFGDAFYNSFVQAPQPMAVSESSIVIDGQAEIPPPAQVPVHAADVPVNANIETLKPIAAKTAPTAAEPTWKNRSPEPPQEATSRIKIFAAAGILTLLAILAFGWYYLVNHPSEPGIPTQSEQNAAQNNPDTGTRTISTDIEVPPLPRKIAQPPNTDYFQNAKANMKGDLLRNYVGFSLYYPKEWKVIGSQESLTLNTRGKFLDISRSTPDGKLKEQMLISYYQSKGTFKDDTEKFPLMVKEANETLKKLLPGYQMVSEGEIKVNGDWRAYEVKFQGGGTAVNGEKLLVWGRRLFIPAARPGTRDGFEITMIATSLADEVRSVDDVGVHGELAAILATFEPSQNF